MGGWVAIIGDDRSFDERLNSFKEIFSVSGVPKLNLEAYELSPDIRTISWAWNQNRIPDIYIEKNEQGQALVLTGAITGLGRLGQIPANQQDAASRILELWVENQDQLIDQLNGSFSCLFFDSNRQEANIFTDRFASRSVWFTRENDLWIWGNYPSALAAVKETRPKIDPAGLWSLFCTGRHVGRHGLYGDTECLLAGEKAVLIPGKPARISRWRRRRYSPDINLSPREWGSKIAGALKESARRYQQVSTSPYLFLSGGLDSRVAAAAFGPSLKGVSLCSQPNAETKLASLVAKTAGIEHQTIIRSPYWYLDTLDAAALISAGNYLTCHAHFIVPAGDITSRDPQAQFLLGDLLESLNKNYFSTPSGQALIYDPKKIRDVLHLNVPFSQKDMSRLGIFFNPDIKRDIEEAYLGALEGYAQSLMDVSKNDADRFNTFLRWADVSITPTYNMITCLWPMAGERNIFFDNDVDELALKIPSQLRGDGVIHRWILYYLSKKLSLIPDANTFLPPIFPNILGAAAKKIRPVLGKIRRGAISRSRDKPVLTTSGSWVLLGQMYRKDRRYREQIESTLHDENLFPPEIFDNAQIRNAWKEYLAGDSNLHFEIDTLLSFGSLSRLIPYDGLVF